MNISFLGACMNQMIGREEDIFYFWDFLGDNNEYVLEKNKREISLEKLYGNEDDSRVEGIEGVPNSAVSIFTRNIAVKGTAFSYSDPAVDIKKGSWTIGFWFKNGLYFFGHQLEFGDVIGSTASFFSVIPVISSWMGGNSYTKPRWEVKINNTYSSTVEASPWAQWNHLVCSFNFDNNTVRLFTNGIFSSEDNIDLTIPNDVRLWLRIGGNSYGSFSHMDNLRIYNRELSEAEILAIYNAEKP